MIQYKRKRKFPPRIEKPRKSVGKFDCSDWGAHQISLDFAGLRKWISLNDYIMPDTRRYLLLLDSLRHAVY